jgi:hypothetical protein
MVKFRSPSCTTFLRQSLCDLRQLLNGTRKSKQIEKRIEELRATERLNETHSEVGSLQWSAYACNNPASHNLNYE